MSSKRGTRIRTSLVVIAMLLIVGFGVIISRRIFADVTDTCTGADVDLIPAAKGDFGVATSFDASKYTSQGSTFWFYNGNTAPSITSGRLILGSSTAGGPVNPTIYYKFATPLRKEKLYEFKVQFETDFGTNDDKVYSQLGIMRNNGTANASVETLKSTADNTLTEITSYFSPLRTSSEFQTTYPDYFYLNLVNKDSSGQGMAGTLKVKKITIKESCLSSLAKTNPNLFKSVVTQFTYAPVASSTPFPTPTPISALAYHRAVPWNIGEVNALVAPSPSPIAPSSSGKTTLFSHDTDSLEPLYQPAQSEVIGPNASNDSAKTITTTAVKGEKKRVYFSLHNNSNISNLAVSVSDFAQGEVPPEGGISPTPTATATLVYEPTPSPSPTPSITVTVTHTPTVTPTSTSTVILPVTPVPVETESVKIAKGWTTVGPREAFNTSDFSNLGLSVFQIYGSSWKISNPGGENFYTGAPAGLYVYNPSDARTVMVNIADITTVPATEHIKTGWNLLFNNSDSGITAGKYMVKVQNGGATQSTSLYNLVNQGVAYNSAPVILSTEGSTASYDYVDLSKSGTVIPAKKAFWFYMFEDWPKVSQAQNANIAYAADVTSSAVTPTGTVDSMRLKAKQPSDLFTGTYAFVNEIVEPFTQMSNTAQNNLAAGRNESFSVEVNVPENITAGYYAANININADGQQQTLPLKIRVRDFTLENISSPRIVYPPNEIFKTADCKVQEKDNPLPPAEAVKVGGTVINTGCPEVYRQIDAFTDKMLSSGFNGFQLSATVGKGQTLGQIAPPAPTLPNGTFGPINEVTGFTLSPASEYFLAKAKTDPRITSKYLIGYENLVGEIMFRKGYITAGKEASDYVKQTILLGMEKPASDPTSVFYNTYHNNPAYNTLSSLTESQINEIKDQVKTVFRSINSQIATLTGKSNFWTLYPVDEAGRGSGELAMGKFNADIAKTLGITVFITGSNGVFQQSLDQDVNFDVFCFAGGLSDNTIASMNGKTPCFYGGGAYGGMMGSEVINRYLSGFRPFDFGVSYMLFWKYTSVPWASSTDQMNDFNQNGIEDNGRDWLTEYYNNEIYRQSYLDYYGNKTAVETLASTDKYRNITTQEFIGLEEANTDMKYLETLAKKIGWSAVNSKLDNLPDDLKLPKPNRTLYGVNMSKEKLNKIRDLIADEIEK